MKVKVQKQNVGIDVSKDDFKVNFQQMLDTQKSRIKGSRTFKNTSKGFIAFEAWVEKRCAPDVEVRFTMEATGVYHESLAYFLHQSDYYVSIILANTSKAFAKSLNMKTKTDQVDAKLLGQMGLERDLDRWQPLSGKIRILKQLTRERVALLEEKLALENRLHALNHSFEANQNEIKRIKQRISWTKKQIKQVELQVEQFAASDPDLTERIDNICLVKGLGLITVVTIIAETNGFELFNNKGQVVSFAGYDVVQRTSGSSIRGKTRISKKGNRFIRRALHFPALTVIKYEDAFKQLYDRVFERSGIKMKAAVAIQRKLLVLIYTLFTKNEAYDPKFSESKQEDERCRQDTRPAYSG